MFPTVQEYRRDLKSLIDPSDTSQKVSVQPSRPPSVRRKARTGSFDAVTEVSLHCFNTAPSGLFSACKDASRAVSKSPVLSSITFSFERNRKHKLDISETPLQVGSSQPARTLDVFLLDSPALSSLPSLCGRRCKRRLRKALSPES